MILHNEIVFPITENEVKTMYITNASFLDIDRIFMETYNTTEFIKELKNEGYSIEVYRPSIELNFDV